MTEAIFPHLPICLNLQTDPMKQIAYQEGPLSKEVMGITLEPGLITDRDLVKREVM